MRQIKVYVMTAGALGEERTIPNSLTAFQSIVDGYIEHGRCTIGGRVMTFYCNEEGQMRGLPISRVLPGHGYVFGPIVFTDADPDGDDVGLTDEQIEVLRAWDRGA